MQRFEYKVIPAPKKGEKAKGVRSSEDRFAYAMAHVMNDLGRDGWEYLRADTLPCEERVGLTGSKTTYQTLLVFRRAADAEAPMQVDVPLAAPPLALLHPVSLGMPPRVGAAEAPAGQAPALGPARADVAAE